MLTAENWPIAAALLPFPATTASGAPVQTAPAEEWLEVLQQVADAGFRQVDLTDGWLRVGELSDDRLDEFAGVLTEARLSAPSLSAIRRSVIDAAHGEDNLRYSHRAIDAAARLGCQIVSVGLHQALTGQQKEQLWFWTVQGHRDPVGDEAVWNAAVQRLGELGRHAAEVGLLLSLEMYEDTYIGTGDSAVRMVEAIGLPEVGLNPDIGNLVRLHRPIEPWREVAEKTLPYANFWHVKNYYRDEDVATGSYIAIPAPMEFGLIDYREAFRMALSAGFQGVVCTEHYGGDGLSVSATNQAYLRERVLPKHPGYRLGASRVRQPGQSGADR